MNRLRALRAALSVLSFAALFARGASADVHVVSAFGGGDFTSLQAAVDAAADGDVLLVRDGTYAGFTLFGKGLTVAAEPGQAPQVTTTIRVDSVPAGSSVVLAGLSVSTSYTTDLTKVHGLVVNQCSGAVRVQECSLTGANNANNGQPNFGDGSGARGAVLLSSANVVFTRCELVGGRGHQQYDCCDSGGTGGAGLTSISTVVALFDCQVTGGKGGYSGWGGSGGAGVNVPNFGVFATGCTFTGGEGGFGDDFIFGPGGSGGAGLSVGAGAQAQLRDNALAGGAGGGSFLGMNGAPGQPLQAEPGSTVITYPGAARRFTLRSVGWEGSSVQLTVEGQPGDRVWFPGSSEPGFRSVASLGGVWALALPVKMLAAPQGIVPASGVLELLVPITDLPGEGDQRYFQGYVVAQGGQAFLGTPNSFTRLGCAFSPD